MPTDCSLFVSAHTANWASDVNLKPKKWACDSIANGNVIVRFPKADITVLNPRHEDGETIELFFLGIRCGLLVSFLDLDLPPEVRRAIATIHQH